jgi:hypothetical protein
MTMQHPRDGFAAWLDGYVAAWRSGDGQAIAALFSPEARYSYRAGRLVVEGRDAIVSAWLEDDAGERWEARYEPLALDGEVHVAQGWTRYFLEDGSLEQEYSNIFVCRFDDAGRCSEFTEWWMRTDDVEQTEAVA